VFPVSSIKSVGPDIVCMAVFVGTNFEKYFFDFKIVCILPLSNIKRSPTFCWCCARVGLILNFTYERNNKPINIITIIIMKKVHLL
jgi:hypothetical protein